MDPTATWIEMAEAHKAGDTERLQELAQALRDWLRKGGFPPLITAMPEWDRMVAMMVTERF